MPKHPRIPRASTNPVRSPKEDHPVPSHQAVAGTSHNGEWQELLLGHDHAAADAEALAEDPVTREILSKSLRGRPLWGKYSAEAVAWRNGAAQPSWWMLICEMDFTLGHAVGMDAFRMGLDEAERESWREERAELIERADVWMEKVERLPAFGPAARLPGWWVALLLSRRCPLRGDTGVDGSRSAFSFSGPVDYLPPPGFSALKAEGKAQLESLKAHLKAPVERRAARLGDSFSLPHVFVPSPASPSVFSSSPAKSGTPAAMGNTGAASVDGDDFRLSSDEVAAKLGVSRARVHALASAGRLASREGLRAGRRVRLFSEASVAAVMRGRGE